MHVSSKLHGILQYPIVFRGRASKFLWNKVLLCFWVGHQNGTKSRKFWVSYNFLIRTQKNFQAKIRTFLKILFLIFWKKFKTFSKKIFTKRKFRPRPRFWLLFHQNRTTRKYFLRGCTTVGGGSVARRWKNIQNQILIGTQVFFYTFCQENLPRTMPFQYCRVRSLNPHKYLKIKMYELSSSLPVMRCSTIHHTLLVIKLYV